MTNGISTEETNSAAPIRPAGVVLTVAVIVASLPKLISTVPFISSGWDGGASVVSGSTG